MTSLPNTTELDKNITELQWKQSTHVIEVPQFKMDSYKKLLNKLKRFSSTLGFPRPSSIELSEKVLYLVYDENSLIHSTESLTDARELVRGWSDRYLRQIKVQEFALTIVDDVKPMDEWEILGVIDYKDSLVKPVPGKEIPMEELRDIPLSGNSDCDHCNRNIYRNKTIFVRNTKDGEIKHVGGSCTKYYLGMDYERFLNYIESLHEMEIVTSEYDEDWVSFGQPMEEMHNVSDMIKYYIWYTKHNGHMTTKQVDAYNAKVDDYDKMISSTSGIVLDTMTLVNNRPNSDNISSRQADEEYNEWISVVEDFNTKINTITDDEVKEVLDFVETKKEESSFMFNVYNHINESYVKARVSRFITGVCSFYFSVKLYDENQKRIREKELEESGKKPSTYIGEIDKKSGFKSVEVTRLSGYQGSFGWVNIYTMEDERGNVITKFGTINERYISCDSEEVVVGTKLSFTSPIMDHTEFRGTKQTKIGRLSKYNPKLNY